MFESGSRRLGNEPLDRRQFLTASALLPLNAALPKPTLGPIIDTHIHLFDPTRPQGVPWPPKEDHILYKPALPDRYQTVVAGLGVVGAIEIECSPWPDDNNWVLNVAAKNPIIVGTIGDLEPASPEFYGRLDRLQKNPLWLGIRYGDLWGRDLGASLAKPEFLAGLEALADAGLAMDAASPGLELLASIVRLTDKIPKLRVVIDHLPQFELPDAPSSHATYDHLLKELAARPQVYVKISEVPRRINGRVSLDVSLYRDRLDGLWQRFGEDRLLFGSDWPNCDLWAEYPQVLHLIQEYVASKGAEAAAKLFWKNSVAAYRWKPRDVSQQLKG